ncbi:MAG: Eco57I restriction-modification methylase domain-containing protein, partial [Bacteroidales bacterium]|nr:Eco57I restriction-modification methylase domain-containing protein [Bacteroidales bacterium]
MTKEEFKDIFSDNQCFGSQSFSFFNKLNIRFTNGNPHNKMDYARFLKEEVRTKVVSDFVNQINEFYYLGVISSDSLVNKTNDIEEINYFNKFQDIVNNKEYKSIIVFAIKLKSVATRSQMAELTRAFNRITNGLPIIVIYKCVDTICLTLAQLTDFANSKKTKQRVANVIMLKDISINNAHEGHIRIIQNLSKHNCKTFDELYLHFLKIFDIKLLTDSFYGEILNWYLWATGTFDQKKPVVPDVHFPDIKYKNYNLENNENKRYIKLQCNHAIRLITRLIFCWFLKQKGLIDNRIFDYNWIEANINNLDNYYNAILQNLFFATLNCEKQSRRWFTSGNDYQNPILWRDSDTQSYYKTEESKQQLENILNQIPYLNGGLFDCLDSTDDKKKTNFGNHPRIYVDGFSRRADKKANIPSQFFFAEGTYDSKTGIMYKGLIRIFNDYYFTVAENTSSIKEVALDPELLGNIFEQLLGVFNPETNEISRKSSGSFYTPKEIVDYMVNESLKQYLENKTNIEAQKIQALVEDYQDELNTKEKEAVSDAILNCKIFDPACGSGAFPMGCLNALNNIIKTIDSQNNLWKQTILKFTKEARNDNNETISIEEYEEKEKHINEVFEFSKDFPEYARKLYILDNCIFGSDIQRIAMQITKLRFFISLVCEQPIDKIKTLPNLETKFCCANTLIPNDFPSMGKDLEAFENEFKEAIHGKTKELKKLRSLIFNTPNRQEKNKLKEKDEKLRNSITDIVDNKIEDQTKDAIKRCKQKISNLEKTIADLQKIPDDTTFKVLKSYDIFGNPTETKIKNSNKKEKLNKYNNELKSIKQYLEKLERGAIFEPYKLYANHLQEWDPYDLNAENCSFFNSEWMFGIKDGFDIVIGNPPYIQLQKDSGRLATIYQPFNYETFTKTGDLYCLFYERASQLLKPKGFCCFITSNKWMRAGYGEQTRSFFANNTNPLLLVDFAGVKVFESATVDTNILLFQNCKNKGKTLTCVTKNMSKNDLSNLSLFVQQHSDISTFNNSDSWVILSTIEQSIKHKIESVGTLLKDWDINIYRGVLTGYNEAFIISTEKRNEILSNCKTEEEKNRTAELIRPILRGRDIKRYGYEWDNLWLIATFPSRHYDIEKYQAVKQYLLTFGIERLEQTGATHIINGISIKARKKTTNKWFEVQDSIAYWEDFCKPKVVYPNMTKYLP